MDEEGLWLRKEAAKKAPKMTRAAFDLLGYDEKIALGVRSEHFTVTSEQTWREINHHLGTSAASLPELVEQLAQKRFGHSLRVGDCFFCGGSIPFEAARIGCAAYGSDLNPIAGLLTWAGRQGRNQADGAERRIEASCGDRCGERGIEPSAAGNAHQHRPAVESHAS